MNDDWVAGWQAGMTAASARANDMARRMRGFVANDPPTHNHRPDILTLDTLSKAALLEQFADLLAEMQPPTNTQRADHH